MLSSFVSSVIDPYCRDMALVFSFDGYSKSLGTFNVTVYKIVNCSVSLDLQYMIRFL